MNGYCIDYGPPEAARCGRPASRRSAVRHALENTRPLALQGDEHNLFGLKERFLEIIREPE